MLKVKLDIPASLQRKLDSLENPSRTVARGLNRYALWLQQNELEAPPPETAANRPPGINGYSWYVRNFGTVTRTGRKYATSEKLTKRWEISVKTFGTGARATISNNASYGPFVQGRSQVRWAALRGWKRTDRLVDTTKARAVREVEDAIDRELSR